MANTTKLKRKVGVIDMTPSWEGLLPGMLAVLADVGPASAPTVKARGIIREELARMAQAADKYIEAQKNPVDAHHTASTLIAEVASLRKEKSELVGALREALPACDAIPNLRSVVLAAITKAEGRA